MIFSWDPDERVYRVAEFLSSSVMRSNRLTDLNLSLYFETSIRKCFQWWKEVPIYVRRLTMTRLDEMSYRQSRTIQWNPERTFRIVTTIEEQYFCLLIDVSRNKVFVKISSVVCPGSSISDAVHRRSLSIDDASNLINKGIRFKIIDNWSLTSVPRVTPILSRNHQKRWNETKWCLHSRSLTHVWFSVICVRRHVYLLITRLFSMSCSILTIFTHAYRWSFVSTVGYRVCEFVRLFTCLLFCTCRIFADITDVCAQCECVCALIDISTHVNRELRNVKCFPYRGKEMKGHGSIWLRWFRRRMTRCSWSWVSIKTIKVSPSPLCLHIHKLRTRNNPSCVSLFWLNDKIGKERFRMSWSCSRVYLEVIVKTIISLLVWETSSQRQSQCIQILKTIPCISPSIQGDKGRIFLLCQFFFVFLAPPRIFSHASRGTS